MKERPPFSLAGAQESYHTDSKPMDLFFYLQQVFSGPTNNTQAVFPQSSQVEHHLRFRALACDVTR
jgi:hypothetical protein